MRATPPPAFGPVELTDQARNKSYHLLTAETVRTRLHALDGQLYQRHGDDDLYHLTFDADRTELAIVFRVDEATHPPTAIVVTQMHQHTDYAADPAFVPVPHS